VNRVADEPKLFPPSPEFSKNAYFRSIDEYEAAYKRSVEDPEGYWTERAKENPWSTEFDLATFETRFPNGTPF
jgi:acetyl-CoA synthetase